MNSAVRWALAGVFSATLLGCASHAVDVRPLAATPAAYDGWPCDRLHDQMDAVQLRAADLAWQVDGLAGRNLVALGVGVAVFWPALLAMRPDGDDAAKLAELKGKHEGLRNAAERASCPPPSVDLPASRAAVLPVAVGDRLVYEERQGERGRLQVLGLRLMSVRRDRIDFQLDLAGRASSTVWSQDLLGNVIHAPPMAALAWRHLVKPDLELGQAMTGELLASGDAAGDADGSARVRGQVVALSTQVVSGRRFEVAVIELFGDAPLPSPDAGAAQGRTRLEGVIALDRASGVLLRLDLRCANQGFAVRRRLVAVESAAS